MNAKKANKSFLTELWLIRRNWGRYSRLTKLMIFGVILTAIGTSITIITRIPVKRFLPDFGAIHLTFEADRLECHNDLISTVQTDGNLMLLRRRGEAPNIYCKLYGPIIIDDSQKLIVKLTEVDQDSVAIKVAANGLDFSLCEAKDGSPVLPPNYARLREGDICFQIPTQLQNNGSLETITFTLSNATSFRKLHMALYHK